MFPRNYDALPIWRQCLMGTVRGLAISSFFWTIAILYFCLTNPYLCHTFWR